MVAIMFALVPWTTSWWAEKLLSWLCTGRLILATLGLLGVLEGVADSGSTAGLRL
jgi:hypothetical protein